MVIYRPEDALSTWRHLVVVVPTANITGSGLGSHTMGSFQTNQCQYIIKRFAGKMLQISRGQIWPLVDTYTLQATLTTGLLWDPARPEFGYYTHPDQIRPYLAAEGVRMNMYNTMHILAPQESYNLGPNGLTGGFLEAGGVFMRIDTTTPDGFTLGTMCHEFMHCMQFMWANNGHPTINFDAFEIDIDPDPDPGAVTLVRGYRHVDDTPFDSAFEDPPREYHMHYDWWGGCFNGDCEVNYFDAGKTFYAVGTFVGWTDAMWLAGPRTKLNPTSSWTEA